MARDANLEVWENPTDSLVSLHKLDHRGVPYDVLVLPHRRVNLTPEERDMNEGMCASDELNPFRNGLLRPIKLVEDPEDGSNAVVTANAKSDDELAALLKKSHSVFEKALDEINSPITLRRFLSVAKVADGSVKQVQAIQDRLDEIAPSNLGIREVVEN